MLNFLPAILGVLGMGQQSQLSSQQLATQQAMQNQALVSQQAKSRSNIILLVAMVGIFGLVLYFGFKK